MGLLPKPLQPVQPPPPPQNAHPIPKGPHLENVKTITTLRSGRILDDPYKTKGMAESSSSQQQEEEEFKDDLTLIQVQNNDKGKAKDDEDPATYKPRAPFPTALEVGRERKRQHIQAQYEEFMNLFRQVYINIPLLEAIHHVPAYAKFLKEFALRRGNQKFLRKLCS